MKDMYEYPERIIMQDRGSDALTAMLAGNGSNNWMNNPFIYLVFLMMFGQNGFGFGGNNAEVQALINALSSQMSDNQNSNLLMDAIKGNTTAIGQLATNLNCDFNTLNSGIAAVKGAVDTVAGQVGFSTERVINAVNMGDCGIITAIKDCCCNTLKEIIKMGYENQLANCNQTNTIVNAINGVENGMSKAFASVAYETQAQTCALLNAGKDNTLRIIDTLNNHWNGELRSRYDDARLELSQKNQNEYLLTQLYNMAKSSRAVK